MKFEKKVITRVAVVIIVPLLVMLYTIPAAEIELDSFEVENTTVHMVTPGDILPPTPENSIRRLFGSTLGLTWYDVCFDGYGTHMEYKNGTWATEDEFRFEWQVEFNGKENLTVTSKGPACTLIRAGDEFSYRLHLTVFGQVDSQEVREKGTVEMGIFSPRMRVYAKPEGLSLLVERLLFFISELSVIWLASRIYKLIRKGPLEA